MLTARVFEAAGLVLQLGATLCALEAGGVPLLLHGAEIILVLDPDPAPGTQGRFPLAPLTGLDLKEKEVRRRSAHGLGRRLTGVKFLQSY